MNSQNRHRRTQEIWHGDRGQELRVTCADGVCLAEFSLGPNRREPPLTARVEILFQPRDDRRLPCGPPVLVLREAVPLRPQFGSERRCGRLWLPQGLSPETIRDCYFRIVAASEGLASSESDESD